MSTQTNTSDSVPPPPRPIRFVHNQGQPPSKRRRINAACLTCRKRKTRCAGERPVCSTCTKNGHRCLGYPEEIKREDIEKLPLDKAGHDRDEHEHEHHNYHDADIKVEKVPVPVQRTPDAPTPHVALEPTMSLANMIDSKHDTTETPSAPSHNSHHPSSLPAQNTPSPTAVRKSERHRVPYFRYFGPTAIVPGFKQMVVSVRDRRRSTAGSMAGTSPISIHSGPQGSSSVVSEAISEELPTYDPNDPAPVHPLIISLINTFFTQMGSSYPFLRQTKFLRMVKEKRVEPILVDSICALSARFSDSPALTNGNDKMPRMERGSVFAQRARQATVDTFPCPTVGAVQACLLMAYEGFGAGQDSALWMYLGLAIRMAVDLGLQKEVGVQYHGEKDALYSQNWGRQPVDEADSEAKAGESSHLNPQEQKELVQERMDTFWAVFVLDRVISSGTGRPVTFRDDDLELSFPEPFIDPATNWPAPYPIFLQIIHLYGRVCDVLNKVRNAQDLTKETWDKLGEMEHELTRLYKNWDWRLQFNVSNFKAYLGAGQGTTFILLHFWFHALFIILHQPTLLTPFAELRSELQLLPDSRELSMSSAKTICDILSFADLIDPKSFIGNPFTCQPIYIAACAFVMESSANASSSPSRASSPPGAQHTATAGNKSRDAKSSRHSLLASAANQNYQKCFNSLQQIEQYWGGATYIITALDQRAKGIWDCETYTAEEYESTKMPRRGSNGALNNPFPKFENKASPRLSGPPIAWTLAGTANSPNSSLTLMYQNRDTPAQTGPQQTQPLRAPSTPPGNMIFDPIRQSLPDSTNMLAPAYPQPNISAVRQSRPAVPRRTSNLSATSAQTRPHVQFDGVPEDSESHDFYTGPRFTPTSQPSTGFDAYSVSPPTAMTENGVTPATTLSGANHMYFGHGQNNFPYTMPWANSMGSMDGITFDSQDIDIAALGLQQSDMMGPWLDYFPSDVLGLLEQQQHQHPHMGQGGH